jgi:cytochrome P450
MSERIFSLVFIFVGINPDWRWKTLFEGNIEIYVSFPVSQTILQFDPACVDFIANIIRQSINTRKIENVKKNDFIDMLSDIIKNVENEANLEAEPETQFEKDAKIKSKVTVQFTEDEIETMLISQGVLLFFAGNDTSSSALAIILHWLAKYPDVQEKLYREIQVIRTFKKITGFLVLG